MVQFYLLTILNIEIIYFKPTLDGILKENESVIKESVKLRSSVTQRNSLPSLGPMEIKVIPWKGHRKNKKAELENFKKRWRTNNGRSSYKKDQLIDW